MIRYFNSRKLFEDVMRNLTQLLRHNSGNAPFNRTLIFILMIPIIYVFFIDGNSIKEYMPDVINDIILETNQFFRKMQFYILEFNRRNFNI